MQKNRKKIYRTDLRPPLIAAAVIGMVLLLLGVVLPFFVPDQLLLYFDLAIGAFYLVIVGGFLIAYLFRYKRVSLANDAADFLSTEIGDMFRYVVDVPYAIANETGSVKLVSGALQDILQIRSPICNIPLGNFCSVPMKDIIAYAKNGGPVKDITVTEDGVPILFHLQ